MDTPLKRLRLMDIELELSQLEPPWPRAGVITAFSALGGAAAGGVALLGLALLPASAGATVALTVAFSLILVGVPVGAIALGLSFVVAGKNSARRNSLLDEKRQLLTVATF